MNYTKNERKNRIMNFLNNLNADNFQMKKEVFERKIENLKKSFQEIFKEHFEKNYNVLVNVPVGLRDQPNTISLQIYGDGEVSPKNYVVDLSESKNSIKEHYLFRLHKRTVESL